MWVLRRFGHATTMDAARAGARALEEAIASSGWRGRGAGAGARGALWEIADEGRHEHRFVEDEEWARVMTVENVRMTVAQRQ